MEQKFASEHDVFVFIYNAMKELYIFSKRENDMAQATFSIRMDADLKKQLDQICNEFGMTTSTAINVFAKAVVRERRIPFEIKCADDDVSRDGALEVMKKLRAASMLNGTSDMTLEEINAEIAAARRGE